MAAVPMTFSGILYDKANKTQQTVTFIGLASITGVGVGGGPIIPPDQVPPDEVKPPLVIWGGGDEPFPTPPIVIPVPPDLPPIQPPATPQPPHEGWNWSAAKSGWYYLYIPGQDQSGPKR